MTEHTILRLRFLAAAITLIGLVATLMIGAELRSIVTDPSVVRFEFPALGAGAAGLLDQWDSDEMQLARTAIEMDFRFIVAYVALAMGLVLLTWGWLGSPARRRQMLCLPPIAGALDWFENRGMLDLLDGEYANHVPALVTVLAIAKFFLLTIGAVVLLLAAWRALGARSGQSRESREGELDPKRRAIVAWVGGAGAVGAFPYLLYTGLWPWMAAAAVLAALLALDGTKNLETEATDAPVTGEWLLAAYAALGDTTLSSVAGFMGFGVGFGLAAVAGSFGWIEASHRHTWGLWAGLVFLFFALIGGALSAGKSLAGWLYRRPAGFRTPFWPLLSNPRRVLYVMLAGVVAFLLLLAVDGPPGLGFCIGLSLILVYTASPLVKLANRGSRDGRTESEVDEFLRSHGYQTLPRPRTGKPQVDPLTLGVDLLARSGDRVFAVDVKQPKPGSAPLEGAAAYDIRRASSVIRRELPSFGWSESRVTPVLVVVGGSLAPSLVEFSREEDVRLAHFADPAVLARAGGDAVGVAEVFEAAGLPMPKATGGDG